MVATLELNSVARLSLLRASWMFSSPHLRGVHRRKLGDRRQSQL